MLQESGLVGAEYQVWVVRGWSVRWAGQAGPCVSAVRTGQDTSVRNHILILLITGATHWNNPSIFSLLYPPQLQPQQQQLLLLQPQLQQRLQHQQQLLKVCRQRKNCSDQHLCSPPQQNLKYYPRQPRWVVVETDIGTRNNFDLSQNPVFPLSSDLQILLAEVSDNLR